MALAFTEKAHHTELELGQTDSPPSDHQFTSSDVEKAIVFDAQFSRRESCQPAIH